MKHLKLLVAFIALSALSEHNLYSKVRSNRTNKIIKDQKKKSTENISNVQPVTPPLIRMGVLSYADKAWDFTQKLHAMLKDAQINGILIKTEGSSEFLGDSYIFFNELKRAQAIKPVLALIENSCMAGCYYAAAGAQKIISNPTAKVGGIGTLEHIERHANVHIKQDSYEADAEVLLFHRGDFKTIFNTNHREPLTIEQETHLQGIVDDLYNQLTEDIATARSLSLEEKDTWANGRYFTGRQAHALKLIDYQGSLSNAFDSLRELLKARGLPSDGEIELIDSSANPEKANAQ